MRTSMPASTGMAAPRGAVTVALFQNRSGWRCSDGEHAAGCRKGYLMKADVSSLDSVIMETLASRPSGLDEPAHFGGGVADLLIKQLRTASNSFKQLQTASNSFKQRANGGR
jgi:hypothetical protein